MGNLARTTTLKEKGTACFMWKSLTLLTPPNRIGLKLRPVHMPSKFCMKQAPFKGLFKKATLQAAQSLLFPVTPPHHMFSHLLLLLLLLFHPTAWSNRKDNQSLL